MARLEIFSVVNGTEVLDPFDATQMASHAASSADHQHGRSVTKPRVATELSKYRLCLHESSHACLANLAFGRPIVRVTINPDDKGNIGHTWSYHNGKANRDDLVIVAAGRISEEELLGDVYEIGCTGDDEILRSLALKLGDANTLLRETEASARELVKQYAATIRRFALRLAAKREFVLDEAEAAIRQAHEEVTQRAVLDDAWQKKIARAQAEISSVNIRNRNYGRQHPNRAGSSESSTSVNRPIYVLGTSRSVTRTSTLNRLTLVLATLCRGLIDDAA